MSTGVTDIRSGFFIFLVFEMTTLKADFRWNYNWTFILYSLSRTSSLHRDLYYDSIHYDFFHTLDEGGSLTTDICGMV